ncbi:MAG: hypothetical protein JWM68_625 [Verrucomicrobiales bacterium]|nr:hypothetical protein [Verrucomicrobiales bacterium]
MLVATVSIFTSTVSQADEDSKSRILDFKIAGGFGSGFLREQETVITIQWPVASGKLGDKHSLPDPKTLRLQFWLLKADGSAVQQTSKPSPISFGSFADYSTDYMIYTFAKVPTNEISGVVMSLDGTLYCQEFGNKKSKIEASNTPHEPPLTAEQTSRIANIGNALESAGTVTLYALDPSKSSTEDGFGFHGFGIESSLVLTNASKQKTIAKMLHDDLGNDDENGNVCFNPYHGLRIAAGTVTYDLVISSECGHMHIYSSGGKSNRLSITSRKTQDFLDSILTAANIPHLARPQ